MEPTILIAVAVAVSGLAAIALGWSSARQPVAATDPGTYLRQLDLDPGDEDADAYSKRMAEPFITRAMRPAVASLLGMIRKATPANHIDRIHHKLLIAGMSTSIRAEEFVTLQVLATAASGLAAAAYVALARPDPSRGLLVCLLLVAAGALGPYAWLNRKASERQTEIFRDLPDVMDLLAISVEAGMGFEGAMDVVCTNFSSPLAFEFARTLKEMELGLTRREALQNLKRRTEVPELSNFVLAITQADALGMPLGRVLHTQATELRSRRRQWAREKAGKLPVKILFPLVLFIFPAIMVVILGPATESTFRAFR